MIWLRTKARAVGYILPMLMTVMTLFVARAELERAAEHSRIAHKAQIETQGNIDAFLTRLDAALQASPPTG